MTVGELIHLLAKHEPDLRVVVDGYENGFDDLSPEQVSVVKIALNEGVSEWEGEHQYPNRLTDGRADLVEALVLRRPSSYVRVEWEG